MTLFLLKKGARVNQRDSQKRTALSIAARKNNVSIVNELINFGAKPDRYGANKETPLIIHLDLVILSLLLPYLRLGPIQMIPILLEEQLFNGLK